MKVKTSIKLSKDVLTQIDRLADTKKSRSAFIERLPRRYLSGRMRGALTARDLERINNTADQLNLEAEEVLEYQEAQRGRRRRRESRGFLEKG